MAVPQRKLSRSNTRHRRSSWQATPADLVPVVIAGEVHPVPRRLVPAVRRGLVDPQTGRPVRNPRSSS